MPSQRRSSSEACAAPAFTRGPSMSSMRRRRVPPRWRARSHATRKVRALPRWSAPVGLGARRPRYGRMEKACALLDAAHVRLVEAVEARAARADVGLVAGPEQARDRRRGAL